MSRSTTKPADTRLWTGGRWAAIIIGAFVSLGALQAAAPAVAETGPLQYRVSPGDRLAITVLGQPELSGDFVVDGQGSIQLPLTGPITVGNLTVEDARQRINQLLADGILTKPAVAVRVSEMQPIFVLGDVRTPGAYTFRFNSTVKSALAMAGGAPAPGAQNAVLGEFLQAEERYRQLASQRRSLLVRKARLEAERDGKTSFVVPMTGNPEERADFLTLLGEERDSLRAAIDDRREQVEQLAAQKQRIKESIDALNGQLTAMRKRMALAQEKTEIYNNLERKGYGRRATKIDALLVEAGNEGDVWRLRSEISVQQSHLADVDSRIRELTTTHQRKIRAELNDLRMRLRDVDAALPTAQELREVRLQLASYTSSSDAGDTRQYTITRTRNGVTSVMQVGDTALLEPGDVVEVKRPASPMAQIQANLAAGTPDGGTLGKVTAHRLRAAQAQLPRQPVVER